MPKLLEKFAKVYYGSADHAFFNCLLKTDSIARDLYHGLGGMSLPRFLRSSFRIPLLEEIEGSKDKLKLAERVVGKVEQEIYTLYIGEADEGNGELLKDFPLVRKLREEYNGFYRKIGRHASFGSGEINSIGIHRYPENSIGITPHQDFGFDKNMISIFVLKGNAPFYVCKDRDKSGSQLLDSPPGSLILLRAPRKPKDQAPKPFHYIDGVKEERYSLIFRQKQVDSK